MAWILSSGESLKGFKQSHDVLTDHSSVRKIEQCELKKESKAIADNPPRRAVPHAHTILDTIFESSNVRTLQNLH